MDSVSKKSLADPKGHQSKVVIANHNKIANSNTLSSSSSSSSAAAAGTHQTFNQIKTNQSDSNFEYEDKDNEWDIGIGDLIIDLDADIEKSSNVVDSTLMIPLQTLANSYSTSDKLDSRDKNIIKDTTTATASNMSTMSNSSGNKNSAKLSIDNHQATLDKGLKMKIKRTKMGNKTSDSKHEIVKSEMEVEEQHNKTSPASITGANKRGGSSSSSHKKEKQTKAHCKEKPQENSVQDISLACTCDSDKMTPCSHCLKESSRDKTSGCFSSSAKTLVNIKEPSKGIFDKEMTSTKSSNNDEDTPPPSKRAKCDLKSMVDVCVGTSVGTITEPDCLGPCEPGTSVTLEGIVWHESEGGVLAVNVTWRGKTYVGTLIDCTKHDWAPPRFCDSPTEDLESRLQKGGGRSKRGRNATNDLLNFTETRSSVHSKLRNGSKVPKQDKRRKSKDESPSSSVNGNSNSQVNVVNNHAGNIAAAQKQLAANKKSKNLVSPCAISPVLIECPEQDCSKKYKHANGLKYHQSHAHGTNFSAEDEINAPDSPPPLSSAAQNSTDSNRIVSDEMSPIVIDGEKKPQAQKLDESMNDVEKSAKESSVLEDGTLNEKSNDFKAQESDGVSNESSVDPNFFQMNSQGKASSANNLNLVRCKKNRKSPCENVRSPAYSDISDDDSNTPADTNALDKKASDIQKSVSDQGAGSMLLGSYNHLSFYQSPAFLQSDHLKTLNADKEQTPLDLISKMHLEKGAGSTDSNEPSALNTTNTSTKPGPYQHFPYNLMQTSFPFNGENFPSPFPPPPPSSSSQTSIDDKGSPTLIKQEKDADALKQTLSVKPLSRLEETKEIKIEPDQQQQPPGGFLNYSKFSRDPEDLERRSSINSSNSSLKIVKDEPSLESNLMLQNQKLAKSSNTVKSQKDIKVEEKEFKANKNEGQKPTMETQGPPPPPTNQYYLNLPYHLAGSGSGPPFFADHAIYRNMLVPSSYNSPYHLQNLQMARFSSPEDLSRNTANTKALDLLQQHASQYYNTHKIHELNDRVNQLSKSPSSNIRMSASGLPNPSLHTSSPMPILPPSNAENRTGNSTQQSSVPPNSSLNCESNKVLQLNSSKLSQPPERGDPKDANNRTSSPPPQRHHHTHHHTHVYPYVVGTPYVNPAAVLASQPAVAVINPFTNAPPPK